MGLDAEISVRDSNSQDDTVEYLKTQTDITLIASRHNHGFARANNMGIVRTTGDYVLLLNPDTFVGESTLSECVAFMDSHPTAGGLGVRMLKTDGSDAMESRRGLPTPMTSLYKMCGLCSRFPHSRRFGRYYMGHLPWDEAAKIEIVSGAFCLMRREALNKAGLLDEDFFMYGEDIDLSYRLLKSGYDNWYLPTKILHYKGESTQKSSFRYVHTFYGAMLIFFRKHYGHLSFWLNIPIKTAIYMKAALALLTIQTSQMRDKLGMVDTRRPAAPRYVFIGTQTMLAACRRIADSNYLEASYYERTEQTHPTGHADLLAALDAQQQTYIVYDTEAYSYNAVLSIFSRLQRPHISIGTYNVESGIITDGEVLTKTV